MKSAINDKLHASRPPSLPPRRRFLSRLARDTRANTLAIMAIALIPVSALAGSAIDTARLYVVKVRLQQACDAGVLAGRKFMESSDAPTLDANASEQAQSFFKNNFRTGWMGTTNASFTPTKTTDQQVAGTAQVTVPMTVMKMFKVGDSTLNATCEARFDIADADVMMVLDTTGSMACAASQTGGCSPTVATYTRPDGTTGYYATETANAKIKALRTAVLNFYDTLATSADPTTHIRYGFVTYTSTVNAGFAVRDLSSNHIVDQWNYQTRKVVADANNGNATQTTYNNIKQSDCTSMAGRVPATPLTYNTDGSATLSTVVSWTQTSSGVGSGTKGDCVVRGQPLKPMWRYAQWPLDVSQYKLGGAVPDPSKITGATSTWQGCLEERRTDANSSFYAGSLPPDLDPDLVPYDVDTRWRPMWSDVVYYRGNNNSLDYAGNSTNPYGDTTSGTQIGNYVPLSAYNNIANGYVSCGKPVQRLKTMTKAEVSAYVNATDFKPQGGTYHDTGMIWGTRLISPTGLFKDDTNAWPGRNAPNRYIIFMTDGDMSPNEWLYGMYGIEHYDKRVTGGSYSSAEDYHNARFLAECQTARNRNITVFVIGFGQTLTPQLTNCASPGRAFYASDNAGLETAFGKIAKQVAMLRVSK